MFRFAEDQSVTIKSADKYCCVVVWDRMDWLSGGCTQLSDTSTYVEVKKYDDKVLSQLTEESNRFFKRLYNNKMISEKELKNFKL